MCWTNMDEGESESESESDKREGGKHEVRTGFVCSKFTTIKCQHAEAKLQSKVPS